MVKRGGAASDAPASFLSSLVASIFFRLRFLKNPTIFGSIFSSSSFLCFIASSTLMDANTLFVSAATSLSSCSGIVAAAAAADAPSALPFFITSGSCTSKIFSPRISARLLANLLKIFGSLSSPLPPPPSFDRCSAFGKPLVSLPSSLFVGGVGITVDVSRSTIFSDASSTTNGFSTLFVLLLFAVVSSSSSSSFSSSSFVLFSFLSAFAAGVSFLSRNALCSSRSSSSVVGKGRPKRDEGCIFYSLSLFLHATTGKQASVCALRINVKSVRNCAAKSSLKEMQRWVSYCIRTRQTMRRRRTKRRKSVSDVSLSSTGRSSVY